MSIPVQSSHDASYDHEQGETIAHPLPLMILGAVFAALLVLTFVTVAVTWVDLGPFNVWVALLIAAVKAALVALYFMHLRYDAPFNGLVLLIAFLFVAVFVAAAIDDTTSYQDNLVPPSSVAPAQ